MNPEEFSHGPVLRLFEATAKDACANTLLHQFVTISADVVAGKPGNVGYFFGKGTGHGDDRLVFASLWESIDAVRQHFGDDWQSAYLPSGYENLIGECSLRHIDLAARWFVSRK